MTITKFSELANAAGLNGSERLAVSRLSASVTLTRTDISAAASDNSINTVAGDFVAGGFTVGKNIKVTGFTGDVANNIFSGTLTAVATGKLTLAGTDGDVIVDDAAGESVTITQWESVAASAQEVADLTIESPAAPSDWKDSADLATTANITLSGEQTIDGTMTSASRVLVWVQNTPSQNGLYVSGAGAWSRATDADASAEVTSGMYVAVEGGTVNGGLLFRLTTPDPITLGTTGLTFAAVAIPVSVFVGKTVAGTSYTHVLNDSGKRLNLTNAATKTVTVAPQSSVASPVNAEIEVFNAGAGTATIAPGSGVTLNAYSGTLTLAQYQYAKLKKRANPNTWDVTVVGAGSGSTQGRHAIWVSAGSMLPSAVGGCANYTGGASGSNQPDITYLAFDPTTEEYAQFNVRMPKSWDEGTITFVPVWNHESTTTNFGVVWGLQAVATGNGDAYAVNYGTAQTSTDTGGTAATQYDGPESSAITVAGTPAAEDVVRFRILRSTANGSDTLAVDARLEGVTLYITTNADTDA